MHRLTPHRYLIGLVFVLIAAMTPRQALAQGPKAPAPTTPQNVNVVNTPTVRAGRSIRIAYDGCGTSTSRPLMTMLTWALPLALVRPNWASSRPGPA